MVQSISSMDGFDGTGDVVMITVTFLSRQLDSSQAPGSAAPGQHVGQPILKEMLALSGLADALASADASHERHSLYCHIRPTFLDMQWRSSPTDGGALDGVY